MDGTTVPFVWLPGYCLAVPGHDPHVPIVHWRRDERLVYLLARWGDYRYPRCSIPCLLPSPAAGSGARS